jgi:hypothetical protein
MPDAAIQLVFNRRVEVFGSLFAWLNPNRHPDNDLVDSVGLAWLTDDSYSLVDMHIGTVANNLALVEHDLAFIDANYGPGLLVQKRLPAVLTF